MKTRLKLLFLNYGNIASIIFLLMVFFVQLIELQLSDMSFETHMYTINEKLDAIWSVQCDDFTHKRYEEYLKGDQKGEPGYLSGTEIDTLIDSWPSWNDLKSRRSNIDMLLAFFFKLKIYLQIIGISVLIITLLIEREEKKILFD